MKIKYLKSNCIYIELSKWSAIIKICMKMDWKICKASLIEKEHKICQEISSISVRRNYKNSKEINCKRLRTNLLNFNSPNFDTKRKNLSKIYKSLKSINQFLKKWLNKFQYRKWRNPIRQFIKIRPN